jgi:hypothetical protein
MSFRPPHSPLTRYQGGKSLPAPAAQHRWSCALENCKCFHSLHSHPPEAPEDAKAASGAGKVPLSRHASSFRPLLAAASKLAPICFLLAALSSVLEGCRSEGDNCNSDNVYSQRLCDEFPPLCSEIFKVPKLRDDALCGRSKGVRATRRCGGGRKPAPVQVRLQRFVRAHAQPDTRREA